MNNENVTVKYGVNSIAKPEFSGLTVEQIHNECEDVLNIPEGTSARVNGQNVQMTTRVQAGQTLEFVKAAGEKGA